MIGPMILTSMATEEGAQSLERRVFHCSTRKVPGRMVMTTLWKRALLLEREPLQTVDKKPFTFKLVSERCIEVTTEGGGVHTVSRIQFDRVDNKNLVLAGVSPQQLKVEAGVKKGQSYIAGIIDEIIRRGL
jgi:hypothetical protein